MQRTLVLLKPDAVERALVGRILARFEAKGLRLAGLKLIQVTPALAERHYAAHRGKPFYAGLIRFITSGPVVAVCLEGRKAIESVRRITGSTDAAEAAAGSIRGDFSSSNRFNLVHASDSPESAAQELANFFAPGELVDTSRESLRWLYDLSEGDPL
ncbi:MAG TPA: nucleoside-diphosphate kinase [Planctomycetota bacterium]|nr:nucleoside-diphosphate kinase [Planctomycetota bacterium]